MSRNSLSLILAIIFGISTSAESQINSIMTYNIKYDSPSATLNHWNNRKVELVHMLKYYEPEVIGLQEALHRQLEYMDKQLESYSRIGVGRDDGGIKGEHSPIYYNHELFSVVRESTFWLSEQDSIPSVGWDASMERICTYGLFENKMTAEKFFVFNTHYDHRGQKAREMSSKLIVKKIKELNPNNYPVILMGDLNAEPGNPAIETFENHFLKQGTFSRVDIYGPVGTFTGFEIDIIPVRRLDYIFVSGLKIAKYRHVDDFMKNNNYLSDHLPVFVNLSLRDEK